MTRVLDFSGLNQTLLNHVRQLLPEWLPGGRIQSNEYVCGDINGGPGKSCSINLSTGKWSDFATELQGGDLISLYAAINNLDQKNAFYALRDTYGNYTPKRQPRDLSMPSQSMQTQSDQPKIIRPPRDHRIPYDQNKVESAYSYRDKKGNVLFYITRSPEKKFTPWCYTSKQKWINKHWPSPRPLYRLNLIEQFPDLPVLVVEGEKACHAAANINGSKYVATTWACGSNSWNKTDWTPLYGRSVLIWPDADEPGRKAAQAIADHLLPHCPDVKIIDTSGFNGGKDAADFAFQSKDEFYSWARPLAVKQSNKPAIIPEPVIPEPQIPETKISAPNIPETKKDPDITPSLEQLWDRLGLTRAHSGRPHNSAVNITRALSSHNKLKGQIWYDEFHMKIFTSWNTTTARPLADQDYINLFIFLQDKLGIPNLTKHNVVDAITFIAHQDTRNEPKAWLKSIKWDETPRISDLFSKYFGAISSEYTSRVSRNFMISIIARLFKPGCKSDCMVILEGKQGAYKSSALQALGGKWFTENNNDMNKNDFFQALHGFLLIELSELDSFNKAEATRIKTVLSTASDNFRAPYDRHPQVHPRQSVFIGTTNEHAYLRDSTGGRRFWPIECGTIDLDLIKQDRDQLFAEALVAFKQGESWWEVPESASEEQEKRRDRDPWEGLIVDYITDKDFVTSLDVAKYIGVEADKVNQMVANRISRTLRSLGCVAGNKRLGLGKRVTYGYFTPDSMSSQRDTMSQDSVLKKLPNYAPGSQ